MQIQQQEQPEQQSTLHDFQILSHLGQGSFSSVYKVKRFRDNNIYALKKEKQNALNEVRILASLQDEYLISYKECFMDTQDGYILCIVMEFASDGDLQQMVNKIISEKVIFVNVLIFLQKGFIQEQEIWKIIASIVRGLKILHDKKILHRDLKCANIFIQQDGIYKLGDLNVSKIVQKGLAYTQTGTPYYASPEVWRDEPYNIKSDIWSLGCIIYEICKLKPPFYAKNLDVLYDKVQKGVFEKLHPRYSKELNSLIASCLNINSHKRPNCEQILSLSFVQKVIAQEKTRPKSGRPISGKIKNLNNELLQEIPLPKNLDQLKGQLPKSNYYIFDYSDEDEQNFNNLKQSKNKISRIPPMSAQPQTRLTIINGQNIIGKLVKPQTPTYQSRILRIQQINRSKLLQQINNQKSQRVFNISQYRKKKIDMEEDEIDVKEENEYNQQSIKLPQINMKNSNVDNFEQNSQNNNNLQRSQVKMQPQKPKPYKSPQMGAKLADFKESMRIMSPNCDQKQEIINEYQYSKSSKFKPLSGGPAFLQSQKKLGIFQKDQQDLRQQFNQDDVQFQQSLYQNQQGKRPISAQEVNIFRYDQSQNVNQNPSFLKREQQVQKLAQKPKDSPKFIQRQSKNRIQSGVSPKLAYERSLMSPQQISQNSSVYQDVLRNNQMDYPQILQEKNKNVRNKYSHLTPLPQPYYIESPQKKNSSSNLQSQNQAIYKQLNSQIYNSNVEQQEKKKGKLQKTKSKPYFCG